MRIRYFGLLSGLHEKTGTKIHNQQHGSKIAKSLHLKEREKQLPREGNTHFTASQSHFRGANQPSQRPEQGFWTSRTSILHGRNKHCGRTEQALWTDGTSIVDGRNKHSERTKLASWTDGACPEETASPPQASFRPLFYTIYKQSASAESAKIQLFASIILIFGTN